MNEQQQAVDTSNSAVEWLRKIESRKQQQAVMVSVTQVDANNYCRILTTLGMEEEGDPVAEIIRLIAEIAAKNVVIEVLESARQVQESALANLRNDLRECATIRDAEIAAAQEFIADRGYRRCDIPACNCTRWHGGHMEERFREIAEAVYVNGQTTLQSVLALQAEIAAKDAAIREYFDARECAISGKGSSMVLWGRFDAAEAALREKVKRQCRP